MRVHAIRCKNCGDIIYSRCVHDMRWCSCHSCAIDGGREYVRIAGDNWMPIDIDVEATASELWTDWNTMSNKYGKIKGDDVIE